MIAEYLAFHMELQKRGITVAHMCNSQTKFTMHKLSMKLTKSSV